MLFYTFRVVVVACNSRCVAPTGADNHAAGSVVPEEVSTIMRYLGAYPTEKAMVQEILPDMQARHPRLHDSPIVLTT